MSKTRLLPPLLRHPLKAPFSTTVHPPSTTPLDPQALLSKPTWSIHSLLPPTTTTATTTTTTTTISTPSISSHQLSHLLKLSALPPPTSSESTSKILSDLHSQLHFLAHLQSVDTSDVEPLSSIRDETPEGLAEAAVTVDTVKEALENEERVGKWRRPRRRVQPAKEQREVEKWDVLGSASEKVTVGGGGYFVVRSGKAVAAE
ncbi:hypothetical protein QBC40DRAFT_101810 [Triangularia verruculosa]|uniref:Glutamyl-tRNA amidotransferase complex subunit Gta3 domain-containing protein n=1 Tax=Triangularia verruculosa TaxID=2587418 RepID=A0AAN6XBC0_9PEZI|nr:hypothetical protein QBC40DRAFT_101810 [Triangularia verruculosa]